jgi:hypothetical protein
MQRDNVAVILIIRYVQRLSGFLSVNKCRGGQSSDDINSYWIKITAWHRQVDTKRSRRVGLDTNIYIRARDRGWTRERVPIKLVQSRGTSERRSVIDLLEDSGVIFPACAEHLSMHRSVLQQDYYGVCKLGCYREIKAMYGLLNVVWLIVIYYRIFNAFSHDIYIQNIENKIDFTNSYN